MDSLFIYFVIVVIVKPECDLNSMDPEEMHHSVAANLSLPFRGCSYPGLEISDLV